MKFDPREQALHFFCRNGIYLYQKEAKLGSPLPNPSLVIIGSKIALICIIFGEKRAKNHNIIGHCPLFFVLLFVTDL